MHTSSDIPTHPPDNLNVGDTWKWSFTGDHYKASEGWVLSYAMQAFNKSIAIVASADGDDHLVEVAAATSSAYEQGEYAWQAYMTNAATSERFTVDEGILHVHYDFANQPGTFDGRSHAHKVLDAIEAVIEGRATRDDASYSIAGRALSRMPVEDLLSFRKQYRAEVAAEHRKDDIKHGRVAKNRIVTRFK